MKELFPVYKSNPNLIYLDNAASALKPYKVIDAIKDYYENYSCNVERGVYKLSLEATSRVEESREACAKFINANNDEVIFTSGASHSLNLVANMLKGMLTKDDVILTTELEHHSSFLPFLKISEEVGCKINFIELNNRNEVTVENFKKAITPNTKVLALTHVSNVIGCETPIKEIIKIAHEHNIICSIDGAQAIPHERIDVKDLDCDFYSFSFHKLCGPTGLGLLYGKKELLEKVEPMFFGGEMNSEVTKTSVSYKDVPYKFEAGTLPIAEIFGAKACVDFIDSISYEYINKTTLELRNKCLEMLEEIPEVEIYNKDINTALITFNIKGVHSHDSVSFICENNVCIRAGQHCAEILHTDKLCVYATLRASFYFYNDMNDVIGFVNRVKEAVNFFKEVGYIG